MATTTICDVCNLAPAVGKVSVVVNIENSIGPDMRTGRFEEVDSCEACREAALAQVYQTAREIALEAIPVHAELEVLKREIFDLRKTRETHANAIGLLEDVLSSPALPEDHANAKKDKAHRAKCEKECAVHRKHLETVDGHLASRISRRTELHDRTR